MDFAFGKKRLPQIAQIYTDCFAFGKKRDEYSGIETQERNGNVFIRVNLCNLWLPILKRSF